MARIYNALFNTVFARLDPETAHQFVATGMELAGKSSLARKVISGLWARNLPSANVLGNQAQGLLGVAAGFDKNAKLVPALLAMGFGFVEVGTVTAQAQPGNDKPRMQRIVSEQALVNRMGFNNDGADAVARRLSKLRATDIGQRAVIGVNIGKTKVATDAIADYAYSTRRLAPLASYLVINVSSPNTPGLRDLQATSSLGPIISAVQAAAAQVGAGKVPILVKIAPDLADADVIAVAELVLKRGIAGVVATNTTIAHTDGAGGKSGPLLQERSRAVVKLLRKRLGPDKVIIGAGGINDADSAAQMLAAGANAIQAYTGFIYQGPAFAGRINRRLG